MTLLPRIFNFHSVNKNFFRLSNEHRIQRFFSSLKEDPITSLLSKLKAGEISVPETEEKLRKLRFESVDGFAKLDHERSWRTGLPEVVFAEGKTPEQVREILERMSSSAIGGTGATAMATRVSKEMYSEIKEKWKEATTLQYYETSRILAVEDDEVVRGKKNGSVAVICAGTSDLPVSEEAAVTLELFGYQVTRVSDCGVAGIHRLLDSLSNISECDVVITVAGMDGALPSAVGGLVRNPLIAVPTSVGYGASFGGIAPLLTMLNSCAPGVSVVNIDNGFGAATSAVKILQLINQSK
eukprot:g1356.t1